MAWSSSDRRSSLPSNWRAITRRVLSRDDHRCQLRYKVCIGVATECDHIVPSGSDSDDNLQSACAPCHAIKSSREGHAAKPKRKRAAEVHPGLR